MSSLPDRRTTRQDKTRQDKTRQDKTRQDKTRQPPIILYQIDRGPASALLFFKATLPYASKSARWLNSALTHVLLLWLFLGSTLAYGQNAVKRYRQVWLGLVLWVAFLPATQAATDCNAVTEIPVSECQSLMELYNSTNGPNWKNHTDWNQTNTPCSWFGVTCGAGHVTEIDWSVGNGLTGQIPDLNLPNLTDLRLYHNKLSGNIPNFSNLPNLTTLRLEDNQLSGNIPDFSNLPKLQFLDLFHNQLNGNIPNFSNLPNLTTLVLSSNQLNGSIPNFSNLPNLTRLSLDANQLSGSIPNFSNLPNLTMLELGSNQLSGNIPNFSNLPNLRKLYLDSNQLSGNIPNFSNLPNLTLLYLNSNQLSGNIPNFTAFSLASLFAWFHNNCGLIAYDAAQESVLNSKDLAWKTRNSNCPVSTVTLTITKTGNGTVTSVPAGINCGTTCTANYSANTAVTLTATADTGAVFSNWSSNCQGTTNPLVVTMDAAKNCTATFTPANPPTPTLPVLGQTDNIQFMGGIAVNGQSPQLQALLTLNNPVEVTGNITVDPTHVGKTADIFVYVEAILPPATDALYFMLGEGLKTIAVWDKNPANLIAFQPNVTLNATQSVVMYTGPFVYLGTFKVFFGYRLQDGTMVASTTPITIITSNKGEPHFPGLVQLTSTDTDKITLAWLPAQDDNTPPEAMTYQVHLSDQPNFTPSTATLQTAVTGQEKTEVLGLATGQTYNVLVVAVDQDGNESVERDYRTATTFADPVIVNPNTKTYVDTNIGLGTATTSDGVTFTYPQTGGVTPEVGSTLFSTVGNEMYLRKVTGVTSPGNGVVVQTNDGELAEVLEQATIDNTMILFDVNEAAKTTGSRAGVRTRRSLRADGSRYTVMEWPDKFLVATQIDAAGNDGEVSVSPGVRQGSSIIRIQRESDSEYGITVEPTVEFEPALETAVNWKSSLSEGIQILSGKVMARGKLTAKINVQFDFKGSASVEKKIPFPVFTREYYSYYTLGPVPVQQRIKVTLDAVLSAAAAAKIKASSEAMATASLEMGINYNTKTSQWDILPVTPNFDRSFTASLNAHGEVTGEIRLIPNIEVTFYSVAAANLSIEPFLKGKIAAELVSKADLLKQHGYLETQLTNFDFALQAQAFIGASFKVFSVKYPLLGKTQFFETPEWELFNLPKLEFAAKKAKVGESLTLAVKVADGANNPFNDASIKWWVVPETATVTPKSNRTATFVSDKEGEYTVFFSGHSRLPEPFGRQFVMAEVVVGEADDEPAEESEGECTGNKPVASFTIIPSSGRAPLTVTMDASGSSDPEGVVVNYLWSSSDGQTATGNPVVLTFNSAGTHTVTLTVEDETGCKGTVQQTVKATKGHGIPNRCHGIPNRCHGIPNQCGPDGKGVMWIGGVPGPDGIIPDGPAGSWYPDSSCRPYGYHGNYVNGQREGVWTNFQEGYYTLETYTNGILNGPVGSWRIDDCKPTEAGNYVNGRKEGTGIYILYDNPYHASCGVYDLGTNFYCLETYGANWELNGPVGSWRIDDCSPIGEHGNHGNYVHSQWDGTKTTILADGSYSIITYVNGELNGPVGQWKADDSPAPGSCHGNYFYDNSLNISYEDGVWICYCKNGKITTTTYANGASKESKGSCY